MKRLYECELRDVILKRVVKESTEHDKISLKSLGLTNHTNFLCEKYSIKCIGCTIENEYIIVLERRIIQDIYHWQVFRDCGMSVRSATKLVNFGLIFNKNYSWCDNHRHAILTGKAEKIREFQYNPAKIY